MKLYITPGASSLAAHIALRAAGVAPELVHVDLAARRTESGEDYQLVNPKGYVPALRFEDGSVLTENVAILDWAAAREPSLLPPGALGRSRLLEMTSFIATEIHRSYMRLLFSPADAEKQAASQAIARRFDLLASGLERAYLLGDRFSPADGFLYVMSRWAGGSGIALPERLAGLAARVETLPAVQATLRAEKIEPAFADSTRGW